MIPGAYLERVHRTTMFEPVLALLKERGLSPSAALRTTGLKETDVHAPQTRVSIDQVVRFYEQVARLAPEHDFALAAGARFHLTTYGMWGFAILCSPDLRRGIRLAQQYYELSSPLSEAAFSESREAARWTYHPIGHPLVVGPVYEFVVLLGLGTLISLHQDAIGEEFRPKAVGLTFAPELVSDLGASILRGAAVARSNENSLSFEPRFLDLPNRLGSPMVNRMLIEICKAELHQLKRREGFAGRVREMLIVNGARPIGILDACSRLGVSERSLRRRLAEEGTSYTELRDELTLQAAIELLRDTTLSVDDIAASLGFSDAASFRRSFRRWAGETPSAFRRRAHAQPQH